MSIMKEDIGIPFSLFLSWMCLSGSHEVQPGHGFNTNLDFDSTKTITTFKAELH